MTNHKNEPNSPAPKTPLSPGALAEEVLKEEAKRQEELKEKDADVILPDDLLPGVGDDFMPLRQGIKAGGLQMMLVLFLLNIVDEFDRVAVAVLAPDIQKTFDVSDTVLLGVAGVGGVALVLGSVPLAWLADRVKRVSIVKVATAFWAVAVSLTGFAVNIFQFFWIRMMSGVGQSNRLPVHSSLLADNYPIAARARIFAFEGMGRPIGLILGPFLAGAIATAAGGDEGWRWAFFFFALPPVFLVLTMIGLKEPQRARNEQKAVLGEDFEMPPIGADLPVSISAAFQRLKKIRTFYFLCIGVGTLGFALVTVPIQISLLLEDEYGYGAYTRGWLISIAWAVSLISIPIAGQMFERMFRKDPSRMVRLAGLFVALSGILIFISLRFDQPGVLVAGVGLANACTSAAFVSAGPTISAVAPYRMRAQAFALLPVFIFLMGGFLGNILAGAISDANGERFALSVVAPPAAILAGALVAYGARYMKRDISLAVSELVEEQEELKNIAENPDDIPVLQVRNLDYSYGSVQVLFGVDLEVKKGETVALLGTNGAGKSTLLRAVSGLGIPDRGAVRLNGRTITYTAAEVRYKQGIVGVRGGQAIFSGLTVEQNLEAAVLYRVKDQKKLRDLKAKVYEVFPPLKDKRKQAAEDLSGGQQQMLALGMALFCEPEILLIDELSLGLAPLVVAELLEVVKDLQKQGQTMLIVEQSLNVALGISKRAVFMEKGKVRFEGPTDELAERDDLVRAVFLGAEGG